uniref:Choice-of-anchor D domain-containing protein n=1 Tax=Geobacter metallireducens TaxID=28232 RepID=A0A831U2N0_GEOME
MKVKSIVMVVLGIMVACAALAGLTGVPQLSSSPAPVVSAPADVSTLVAQGKERLVAHDIIGARDVFRQATLAEPANQEAQFLYGVTRILALYEEGQGLTTSGLDSIREIAELTGFSFTSYGLYGTEETAPDELAASTPATGAVIDFLVAKALPEIDGAIANLSAVTDPAFISTLQAEGLNKVGVGPFSADYGDVLAIRSLAYLAKCNVELLRTYGLNVNLPPIVNGDREQLMLYRQLLQNDAELLVPRDPSRLPHAKTALIGFIDSFNQAVAAVKGRSTVDGHLFVLDVPLTDSPFDTTTPDVAEVQKALAEIKASLSGPQHLSFAGDGAAAVVDLSKFFNSSAPINFRSKLADCTGGTVLPDPTLGGMFPLGLGDVQADLIPVRSDIRGIACSTFTAPNLSFNTDYRFFYEDLNYGFKSPPALFPLDNKGTADLAITSISLVGSDRNDFTLSAGTCSSLTPTLAPGTSCSVEVDFMPTSAGSKGAALEVVSNDPDSPRVYANLSGQAMLMTDTPRPGAVTALVASTGTPATLYAARYGEGVFRSSDGGASWVNVTNNLGTVRVKALWVDPANPQVVVAGTFGKGIYKSTNGGTSWTASNSGLNHLFVTTLGGSSSSSTVIYAATHGGLFKSTNAGGTWAEVNVEFTDDVVRTISVASQSPETLYIHSQMGGVFKSTNGGTSWTQLVLPSYTYPSAISVSPADGDTIFVGTYSGVYRSNDGGLTWTLLLASSWSYGIAISPNDPATIYVSNYNGVSRSTDNGATWFHASLSGAVTVLIADRTSPTGVYAGLSEGQIYRSTDSGAHWDWLSTVGSADSSVNVRSFAFDRETSTTVYAGIEGRGVYKSIDGGANWNPANNGLGGVGVWAVATVPHAPGVVLAGGWYGLYRSTDDAANWTATNLTSDVYHLFASSANPSIIFASTSSGVYKSTDQGASWQTAGLNGYFRRVAVSGLNPSVVYALSLNDLYKSADGGATWNKVYSTPYEPWGYRISAVTLAIDPASASTVYLATSSGLYKSTDGGVTMFPANNGLVQHDWMPFVSDLLVIAPDSLLAAADSTIFKTTDGAASWSSLNTGVYNPNTLALASGASYLLVGNSEGVYRLPLPSETPPPSYPLSISLAGAGTVETSTGLFCDFGVCNDSYVDGTDVILIPYPGQYSYFAGWTGCDSLSGDECRVKMTSARSVTATFSVDTTPLQVMAFPASGTYEAPLSVSIIANKDASIYYTLDGTTPTTSSQPYLGPIILESSKTLKYIAMDALGQSQVQTRTYSILSAADFSWAGVTHVSRSDGTQKDALDVGLTSIATSLAGMTLTVNGPNGFAYTFTDADINPSYPGTLSLYKEFASLAPGFYSFNLQDGKGRGAQRFDTHVTPEPIPVVDSATVKYQRKADNSYRFRWAPVNAPKTYYYRFRITTPAGAPVFTGARKHGTIEDVPAGLLQDGLAYRYRVEAYDGPTIDLAYNRSNSSYTDFTPTPAHYDPNLPIFTWAALHNRIEADGSAFVLATFAVDRPETVTFAELTGPNNFKYTFNLTGDYTAQYKEFSKKFSSPLTAGTYTFHVTAGGVEHSLTAPLTAAVTYPAPDTATMQARDLGNGSIRFSWADVNTNGSLYYRIFIQDTQTGSYTTTSRQNQTYVDVMTSDITNKDWRVEVYDSSDIGTVRNRRNGALIPLVVQSFDATKPVLNYFRVRNAAKPDGFITTEFQMSGSDADGTVTALTVSGPSGIAYDLMKEGWKYAANYRLDRPGSAPQGLYTLKAVDNSGKSDTRYTYQPVAAALPVVDYRTFRVNRRLNGDMEFSWAPVGATGPYWYWIDLFTVADRDGDGKPDAVPLQVTPTQTSIRIPAAALPAEPLMFRVVAADGSNFTTINNASYSATVGYHGAGYDYGSLTDGDGDGYASDIDGNDANPAKTPFSSRKLRVTLSGTGEGAVNSIPSLLACDAGTCETTVDAGTSLLLRAFTDSLSLFSGWQGSCTNVSGDCSLTMDGDRSVTAVFTLDAPIRLAGQTPQYFATLAAAYAAAGTTSTIEARGRDYNENFTLNRNVSLIFRGGLDNSFNPTSGSSVLKGVLTIGSGSLVVDKLVIQ